MGVGGPFFGSHSVWDLSVSVVDVKLKRATQRNREMTYLFGLSGWDFFFGDCFYDFEVICDRRDDDLGALGG